MAREFGEGVSEEEIDLKQVFGTVYRHRKAIGAFALAGLVLSGVFAYFKPNVYRAEATVEIQVDKKGPLGSDDMVAAALLGESSSSLDTEIEIIKSRFVALKAMKKVDMNHHCWIRKYMRDLELYNALLSGWNSAAGTA